MNESHLAPPMLELSSRDGFAAEYDGLQGRELVGVQSLHDSWGDVNGVDPERIDDLGKLVLSVLVAWDTEAAANGQCAKYVADGSGKAVGRVIQYPRVLGEAQEMGLVMHSRSDICMRH